MSVFRNYIAGAWREASDTKPNINPSDVTDTVGEYAQGGAGDVNDAVAAAVAAAPGWAAATPQARFEVLDAIGGEILARREELGTLLAREEGKTRGEGIMESARAGQIFKFMAGEALRIPGEVVPSVRPGIEVAMTREPLGVVGIVTPWNFPIAIPAWKIAPALAFGNAVVFKPASLAPGCAWALADMLSRAGLPEGVFNLVMGSGGTVGDALLDHPDVAGISFTGSVETGAHVARRCAARLAKFQLEMGGKNPLLVLDDADLDQAVECAVQGAFFSTGQRCTASSRLIVQDGICDRFVDAVVDRLGTLKVDDALAEGTHIGPVVDAGQLEKDLDYIRLAQDEGGTLAWGGERLDRAREGFYLSPALIVGTTNAMRINREEVFGPVASVIRVADFDEGLATANDTPFGLSAGVCTTSLKHASAFRKGSQAGMVMVNLPTAGVDYHVPFGGRKGSSYGSREQGRYAVEFYTAVKTAYTLP